MTPTVRALAGALAVVLLSLAGPAVAAPAKGPREWRWLLDRAAQAAEDRAYVGETMWVTYDEGVPSVSNFQVESSGDGAISVSDKTRYAVRLGTDGSGLADHERGWFVPLPAADLSKAHMGLSRLEEKYAVTVTGTDFLLDRRTISLEIERRADGELAERLWVDDASGLLLRRETYDGGDKLVRQVSYLSLDLDPDRPPRDGSTVERASRGQRPSMTRRSQEVAEVDEDALAVLREAGWTVPASLPGGYRPDGSFAVTSEDSQPLQIVYGDGLYTVSLFEQRGRIDLSSLPPGAELVNDLGFPAYEWPGAMPQRLVWEADGTTFSLVGDAPPAEFEQIAAALPRPEPDDLASRLRRGLRRLWSWMSPWA